MIPSKPGSSRCAVAALLFAFLLVVVPPIRAQAPLPKGSPAASALVIPVGGTVRLQMRSKKPIKTVFNSRPEVIAVRPVLNDPTTILLTGLQPGVTTIELTDVDNRKERARAAIALGRSCRRCQGRPGIVALKAGCAGVCGCKSIPDQRGWSAH